MENKRFWLRAVAVFLCFSLALLMGGTFQTPSSFSFFVKKPPTIFNLTLDSVDEGRTFSQSDTLRLLRVEEGEGFQIFKEHLLGNVLHHMNCWVPASMDNTTRIMAADPSGIFAGDLVKFLVTVAPEIERSPCASVFLLQFHGKDRYGRLVDGIGRVDCEEGSYLATASFPVPGSYTILLSRYLRWCDPEVPSPGYDENGGGYQGRLELEVRQRFRATSRTHRPTRCTSVDLRRAEIGYFFQDPICTYPHCEGTPRVSHWRKPGLVWSPYHCLLRYYTSQEVTTRLSGKSILFLGDSTMDEAVEGVFMAAGVDEWYVMSTMSVDWNYTDSSGTVFVKNLKGHRLIEAEFTQSQISMYHRFVGHVDLEGNGLGSVTFKTPEFLEYFYTLFSSGRYRPPDLIVFNSGRHDPWQSIEQEVELLDWLAGFMVGLAQEVDAKLLWRTTNIGDSLLWGIINSETTKVMEKHQIPWVDITGPGNLRGKQQQTVECTDGIHFGLTAISHGATSLDAHEAMTQILIQGIFDVLGL